MLALAPNLKGVQRAAEAGAHKITMPVSASEAHSRANINMTCDQAIAEVGRACRFRDGLPAEQRPEIEVGVSTAFGCTIQGEVSEDWVIEMAARLAREGADSVGLSDGVGYANPAQVKRLFTRLRAELGDKAGGAHLHNTRGQGLANVVAALEVGVTTFDASQGGIGGCPYSPGATGNIVTEDLVCMLEAMGLDTGVDLDEARRRAGGAGGGPARRAGLRPPARRRRGEGLPLRRARPGAGGHRQGPSRHSGLRGGGMSAAPASPCRSTASASSSSRTWSWARPAASCSPTSAPR